MMRTYSVIVERDEDGILIAKVPDIPGCYTQATSYVELISRIQEAIQLCIEAEKDKYPPLDFVGIQQVTVGV
jgi:predicted RNase H-like HicB family nuclease